ncbi:MAG TPA: filamentous hemagglutinin N-terminal domain-containing protein, partial [Candidatus Acidoferrum sp.]|nr:filamentous hemagglutinin N-terminal domain-containing protein [Candidatus Acidoferrum sp.]
MAASLVTGLLSATTVSALPEGGVVVSGAGTVSQQSPANMVVRQGSDKLILNWQGFSIGQKEGVRFEQPGVSSVALNRVVGQGPSEIFGLLTANGRVFLTNPNGVLFGPSSHVEVGSLLATTLGIQDSDFLAGSYKFTQSLVHPLASVVNQGEIVAAPGGFVSFVGPDVMNRGTITARLGTIALGAAEGAILDLRGDGLINLVLTDPVRSGLTGGVTNQGTLKADGGYVTLSAKVASDLLHSVVNNEGVIEAKSLVSHGGVVRLTGEQDGIVMNAGMIDVSAAQAGAQPGAVTLAGNLVGNAGTIRALGLEETPGGHVEVTSTGKTVLFSNSLIDVSGVGNSTAGSVRVWSDKDTVFAPNSSLIARGGEQGGEGGFIEVSSG